MLKTKRRSLHLKILSYFEALPIEEQIDPTRLMANHAFLGEDWEKAFEYCSQAATKAFLLNAIK